MDQESADATRTAHEPQLDLANLSEIAAWIAQTAVAGVIGNAVYAYVAAYARRFGPRRVPELKQRVLEELKRVKHRPQVSDHDLRLRVEKLFEEID